MKSSVTDKERGRMTLRHVPAENHILAKTLASIQGIPLNNWILNAISEKLERDKAKFKKELGRIK